MPHYSREEIQLLAQLSPLLAMSLSIQQGRDDMAAIEPYKIRHRYPHWTIGQWTKDSDHPSMAAEARTMTKDVNAFLFKLRTRKIVYTARQALLNDPETLDIKRRKTGPPPINQIEPDELYESVMQDVVLPIIPRVPEIACPIEAMYRAAMRRSVDEDRVDVEFDELIPLEFKDCILHTLEPHEHHVLFAER